MRSGRLLSILILLQLRTRLTAEALAEEFGVSLRTIYRDIDELSLSGVPVQADRGPGGGFQLVGGYRTRLTGLTPDEAQALLMIGLPGPARALGLGPAASRARGKVLAALSPSLGDSAARTGARFHLDPVDWYREPESTSALPALTRAVLDQRRVRMTYESWKATRDWTVDPLGLVLKGGSWYLAARGAGAIRIFNVAKIRDISPTDDDFDRPDDFELSTWWSGAILRFESGLRPGTAIVQASIAGLERLRLLGTHARKAADAASRPGADGRVTVRLPIEGIERAAFELLGLGPEVEVTEPMELRRRVAELARAVQEQHAARRRTRSKAAPAG